MTNTSASEQAGNPENRKAPFDWRQTPPPREADFKTWNKWKADALTRSQDEFLRRNKYWFSFTKSDIPEFFSGKIAFPKLLHRNDGPQRIRFSEAYAQFGSGCRHVAIKYMRGHSSR